MRDLFNALAGHESLEAVLDYYPPECDAQITERDIQEASDTQAAMRLIYPDLRKIDIEKISLVNPRFESASGGLTVSSEETRVVADGLEWGADAYFAERGFPDDGQSASDSGFGPKGILVIKRDGKVYVDLGGCVADLFKSY